jgi:hypothetical protein
MPRIGTMRGSSYCRQFLEHLAVEAGPSRSAPRGQAELAEQHFLQLRID